MLHSKYTQSGTQTPLHTTGNPYATSERTLLALSLSASYRHALHHAVQA